MWIHHFDFLSCSNASAHSFQPFFALSNASAHYGEKEFRTKFGLCVDKGMGIFNGDTGIIEEINDFAETMTISLDRKSVV